MGGTALGLGLSTVTGLVFGLYPAWEATRISRADTLKSESNQASGTRGTARIRKALVCAQVLVSVALLIPAGLFLKSLVKLLTLDLGMRTENLIAFSVSPKRSSGCSSRLDCVADSRQKHCGEATPPFGAIRSLSDRFRLLIPCPDVAPVPLSE